MTFYSPNFPKLKMWEHHWTVFSVLHHLLVSVGCWSSRHIHLTSACPLFPSLLTEQAAFRAQGLVPHCLPCLLALGLSGKMRRPWSSTAALWCWLHLWVKAETLRKNRTMAFTFSPVLWGNCRLNPGLWNCHPAWWNFTITRVLNHQAWEQAE